MEILGFEIKRKSQEEAKKYVSFSPKDDEQSAIEVIDFSTGAGGGAIASFMDVAAAAQSETEQINRYRGMALQPEIATAIDHIINEMVYIPDRGDVINIVTDDIQYTAKIKDRIREEFTDVLRMMDFSNKAYEIIRRWYVDGRLYYHLVIDTEKPSEGIKEIRYIDPRKLKRVCVYNEERIGNTNLVNKTLSDEYYVYSDNGFNTIRDENRQGFSQMSNTYNSAEIRIQKDCVAYTISGLMDINNKMVLSYLDQAFKPLNNLRMLEDSAVIYRVTRAPERRAFYIDVSGLPPAKAEQHVAQLMIKHNNKLQYNSATGQITDDRRIMTMTDDYWLPRKDGTRGTEIVPLAGGTNLGEMDDVIYFQKALFKSLRVPVSRLESEAGFSLGRQSEITRDEANFGLWITRLRAQFSNIFDSILEKQLILKKIIRADDWEKIRNDIRYDYLKNNFFNELKNSDILRERMSLLNEADPFVGKYLSKEWVYTNILQFTDEEIEATKKEIEKGKANGEYDGMGMDGDQESGNLPFETEPEDEPPSDPPITANIGKNKSKLNTPETFKTGNSETNT